MVEEGRQGECRFGAAGFKRWGNTGHGRAFLPSGSRGGHGGQTTGINIPIRVIVAKSFLRLMLPFVS